MMTNYINYVMSLKKCMKYEGKVVKEGKTK